MGKRVELWKTVKSSWNRCNASKLLLLGSTSEFRVWGPGLWGAGRIAEALGGQGSENGHVYVDQKIMLTI